MSPVSSVRYCRCGTYLNRTNKGDLCGACRNNESARGSESPPDVPIDFWENPQLREALLSRHMGRVVRAYRNHPFHGHRNLSQERVAGWLNITQAQLSRVENGMAIVDLAKLVRWADVFGIPSAFLWFKRPDPSGDDFLGVDPVKRSQFLRLGGATLTAGILQSPDRSPLRRSYSELECAHWLAMELWQRRIAVLHISEMPQEIAASLACHVSGSTMILRDAENYFSFAHPSFIDFYLAQQIFQAIKSGDSQPFGAVQTSHETDLVIREFVQRDDPSQKLLIKWMREAPKSVLRVNSGGVLAKVGGTSADPVIEALLQDLDVRQLYLSAVISRVLNISWDGAADLAARVEHPIHTEGVDESTSEYARYFFSQFAAEVRNPRDAAARWCSVVMLSQIQPIMPTQVNQTLHSALMEETSVLTLRTIGSILGGNSPIKH